jgi:hypothetical protein
LIRATACSTTPATHCTVVVMARMLRVPTEPSALRKPFEGVAGERGCAAAAVVAIGRPSSERAAGHLQQPFVHPLAGSDRLGGVADGDAVADDRAPAAIGASATLCPCGTRSTRRTPEARTVPAARPPSLATMATLSASAMRMTCGARAALAFAAVAGRLDIAQSLCLARPARPARRPPETT